MNTTTTRLLFFVGIGSAVVGLIVAGTLEPPGSPAPTMVTLQQIFDKPCCGVVAVAKTGQTICYGEFNSINCAATGQDGELQKGASVSPRFTDNADGTVKDNLTGLIWLKQINCFGPLTWANALSASNTLASGACGLTDGSVAGTWRLPNVRELQSLVDYNTSDPPLPLGHPFSLLLLTTVWSSTTYAETTSLAWYLDLSDGYAIGASKTDVKAAWPVRGGQ